MPDDDSSSAADIQLGGLSTLERFAPSELIICEACDRANSPKRTTCIYCGKQLAVEAAPQPAGVSTGTAATEALDFFVPSDQLDKITEDKALRIAELLSVEPEDLRRAISAGGPLPLFGSAVAAERPELTGEIEALGIQLVGIPLEATQKKSWRKIRAMVLTEEAISPDPSENETVHPWLDLVLVVIGRIVRNRIEEEENRSRSGIKSVGLRQLSDDELLMDLYFNSNDDAWRIQANNFDFSCLQNEKRVTAFENFDALISVMRERAPNAEFSDSFSRKRLLVANVWPFYKMSNTIWSPGIRQKFNYKTVTTSDNESQFDSYSRALQFLRMKTLADPQ